MARPRNKIASTGAAPPISEIGNMGYIGSFGVQPWSQFIDTQEYVPELVWPNSVYTYRQMMTDSQVAALFTGITLPIRRYKWMIDPNGSDPDIYTSIADDLNLDIVGEEPRPRGRARDRFSFDNHMKTALKALQFGHMYFEQSGYIGDGTNGRPDDGLWHLKRLAERVPWTIAQINVASDGGLLSIKQWPTGAFGSSMIGTMPEMPIDRLVAYVWEGDGGNWVGKSLFRPCFKNWVIKDRLLRVDSILHERAGGVPMPVAPADASDDEISALMDLAKSFRIDQDAGGVLAPGTDWQIMKAGGPRGQGPIDSVRYHDESMARTVMMMVAMLAQGGTSLGSYSLGEVFVDLLDSGQMTIANWFRDNFNMYQIEDWVDWNWGEDSQVPLLVYQKDADERLAIVDLVQLMNANAIQADDELEDTLRYRFNLPKRGTPRLSVDEQAQIDAKQAAAEAIANKPAAALPAGDQTQPPTAAGGQLTGSDRGEAPSSSDPVTDTELTPEERKGIRRVLSSLSSLFKSE